MTRLPRERVLKQVATEMQTYLPPPPRIIRLIKLSCFISVCIANVFLKVYNIFLQNFALCFVLYVVPKLQSESKIFKITFEVRFLPHVGLHDENESEQIPYCKRIPDVSSSQLGGGGGGRGGKRGLRNVCIKSASFSFCLNLLMNEKVLCHTKYLSFLLASRVLELEKVEMWVFW